MAGARVRVLPGTRTCVLAPWPPQGLTCWPDSREEQGPHKLGEEARPAAPWRAGSSRAKGRSALARGSRTGGSRKVRTSSGDCLRGLSIESVLDCPLREAEKGVDREKGEPRVQKRKRLPQAVAKGKAGRDSFRGIARRAQSRHSRDPGKGQTPSPTVPAAGKEPVPGQSPGRLAGVALASLFVLPLPSAPQTPPPSHPSRAHTK
jgi:hypothetical protein